MYSPIHAQRGGPNASETEAQYRTAYQCNFWDPLIVYPTN